MKYVKLYKREIEGSIRKHFEYYNCVHIYSNCKPYFKIIIENSWKG